MADCVDRNIWEVVKARSSIDYELSGIQNETSMEFERGSLETSQGEQGTSVKHKKEENGCDSSHDSIVLLNGEPPGSPDSPVTETERICNGCDDNAGMNTKDFLRTDATQNGSEEMPNGTQENDATGGGSSDTKKQSKKTDSANHSESSELSLFARIENKTSIFESNNKDMDDLDLTKGVEKHYESESALVVSHPADSVHSSAADTVVIQSVVTRPTFELSSSLKPANGQDSTGHVVYAHGMTTPLAASSETHVIHSPHRPSERASSPFPFTERLKKLSKIAEDRVEPEKGPSATLIGSTAKGDQTSSRVSYNYSGKTTDIMSVKISNGRIETAVVSACTGLPVPHFTTSLVPQIPVMFNGTSITPLTDITQTVPMATNDLPRTVNTVAMVASEGSAPLVIQRGGSTTKPFGSVRTELFQQTDDLGRLYSAAASTVGTSATQDVTQNVTQSSHLKTNRESYSCESKVAVSNTAAGFYRPTVVVSNVDKIKSKPLDQTNVFSFNVPGKDINKRTQTVIAKAQENLTLYPVPVNSQNCGVNFIPVNPLNIRTAVPARGFYTYGNCAASLMPARSAPVGHATYRYRPTISNFTAFRPVRRTPCHNQSFPTPDHVVAPWDKKSARDLSCRETLQPSPELKVSERQFRPVSPNVKVNRTALMGSGVDSTKTLPSHVKRESGSSDMIHLRLTHGPERHGGEIDRRGSVEQEVDVSSSYSFECALNDSCESPLATVLQLRCDSPVPFGASSKSRSSNSSSSSTTDNKSMDFATADFVSAEDSTNKSDRKSVSDYSEKELEEITSGKCDSADTVDTVDSVNSVDSVTSPVLKKKRSSVNIISKRLEARLPSPVKERVDVDLFRDPRELTREERALQRAMLMFCEMEMKEKVQSEAAAQKKRSRRRLRRRSKSKSMEMLSKQAPGKPRLKTFKEKQKDWVSEQIKMRTKSTAEEEPSCFVKKTRDKKEKRPLVEKLVKPVIPVKLENKTPVENGAVTNKDIIKRKLSASLDGENRIRRKRRRFSADKQASFDDSESRKRKKRQYSMNAVLEQEQRSDGNKSSTVGLQEKKVRHRQATYGTAISLKRKRCFDDERRLKSVKRARLHKQALERKPQPVTLDLKNHVAQEKRAMTEQEKAERSHRVKTYMLVASYSGFKDFKPVVLESRTRGRSKPGDTTVLLEGRHAAPSCSAPAEKPVSKPEFPLLVVEEVHSKPVKETLIAENERLCSIWKESLKAQGKWRGDDLEKENDEEFMDEDSLKEAKKLSVNRNTGETILHKAARLGYHDTVRHYIHEGADPSAKDNAGWTPLHEACARGKLGVVKVLTRYGADVNVCSNDGIRPIHDAAEGGQIDVLRLLLSYGADPTLATYAGSTAFVCAKETNTKHFLQGYLGDLMLQDSSNETPDEEENCWEFAGSSSIYNEESNPESISGIFEGVPDCRDLGEPEFEACDKPFLPTYNLPVEKDGVVIGRRNYMLIQDVLERLGWVRTTLFKRCRSKLEVRHMPWSEFIEEISHNQFCLKPEFVPAGTSSEEPVAELVPLTYSLRSVLAIRVEAVKR